MLSETADSTIVWGDTIACSDAGTGATRDNTWYRTFALDDFGMAGGFHVLAVSFAVQEAASSAPVEVTLASYGGPRDASTIDANALTAITSERATLADTTGHLGEIVDVPIVADIPAGGAFVVEIAAPDMEGTGFMYIGATTAGETRPGYISSATCNVTTPETVAAAGGSGQIIINVTGTR